MRMLLLRGVCLRGVGYAAGDVVEVDATLAAYLIRRGVGVDGMDAAGYSGMDRDGRTDTDTDGRSGVEMTTLPAAETATGRRQRRRV